MASGKPPLTLQSPSGTTDVYKPTQPGSAFPLVVKRCKLRQRGALVTYQISKIRKSSDTPRSQDMGEGSPCTLLVGQSFREYLGISVKLKIHINFNLAIPSWGFYPRELKVPIYKD